MGHRHLRLFAAAAVVAGTGLSTIGTGAAFAQDTVSLSIAPGGSFGSFAPGVARDYTTSLAATATATGAQTTLTVRDPSPAEAAPGHLVNGAYSLPAGAGGQGRERDRDRKRRVRADRRGQPARDLVLGGADHQRAGHDHASGSRSARPTPARRRLRQDPRVHAVEREPMSRAAIARRWPRSRACSRPRARLAGDGLRAAGAGRPGARVRARRAARPRAGRARPHREREGRRRVRAADGDREPGRRRARRRALRRRDVRGAGPGDVPAGRHGRARGPDDLAARRPARPRPPRQRRRRQRQREGGSDHHGQQHARGLHEHGLGARGHRRRRLPPPPGGGGGAASAGGATGGLAAPTLPVAAPERRPDAQAVAPAAQRRPRPRVRASATGSPGVSRAWSASGGSTRRGASRSSCTTTSAAG